MKSIAYKPNTAFKQILATGTLGNRSNVWVVCRKRGNEVGSIHRIGNTRKLQPFKSLKRATNALRKHIEADGKDAGWVILTSDQLARCGLIWL